MQSFLRWRWPLPSPRATRSNIRPRERPGACLLVRARRLSADGRSGGGKSIRMTFADLHMKMSEVARQGGQGRVERSHAARRRCVAAHTAHQPEARERVIRMMSSHPPDHYVKAAEFYTSMPNLVPRLKEIACPVLGICGEEDPSPDRPDLLAGVAGFQQVWIPGARRFTMIESPSAFNAAVATFLPPSHSDCHPGRRANGSGLRPAR